MSTIAQSTSTTEVDLNIDEWLGAPGAESIVIPETQPEASKPNIFSNEPMSFDFLDEKDETITDEKKDDVITPETVADILNDVDKSEAEADKNKGGRPKTDKSGLVEFFKEQIEAKEMFAFDDYDESKQTLDEYLGTLSEKDLKDLYKANVDNIKAEVASSTPKEFFESLPQELQYAAKYVADGGTDLKGLFQALSHVEQTRELNPEEEGDQEQIVRSYLTATGFGNEAEIAEQITEWKDLNSLGKKATGFKPKLDKMQEEIVATRIAEQEQVKIQQQKASKDYMDNVFEALRPGEINGLKLDKTVQAKLYTGLTQPQYASISGRPTNLLGHLLEKYQFVEPNYPLIAEALWLLSDPDDYRKNSNKNGKNQAAEEIARQLKTEQSRKNTTSNQFEDNATKTRKIPRNNEGFFKR